MNEEIKIIEFFLSSIKSKSFIDVDLYWRDDNEREIIKGTNTEVFNKYFEGKYNGIYFLMYDRYITYIGISHQSMIERVWQHLHTPNKIFNRVLAFTPNDFSKIFRYSLKTIPLYSGQIKQNLFSESNSKNFELRNGLVENIEKILISSLNPPQNTTYNNRSRIDLVSEEWIEYVKASKIAYLALVKHIRHNQNLHFLEIMDN